MTQPKISVIVPIYGVEQYLNQCVDSILAQTLKDIEIILVDDGSKDRCPQIVDEYAKKDSRIIAIHKPNGGYGQTMNVGLKQATGEYIAIVEPDDYIDSKMYDDLYKIAKEYDSDIVKSCFYDNLQTEEEQRIQKTKWDDDEIPQNRSFTSSECGLFLYYHPSVWSCIYKREFLNEHNIRFIEAPGAGWTDNPFQVQTMCLAERINYTPNAYYYWRRVNANESDDLKDYTLPFKRSDEIHKWLEENDIKDENILVNLYRRELAYIHIVLGKKGILNNPDCLDRISKMLARMDGKIFSCSEYENKQMSREYQEYLRLKNNPRDVYKRMHWRTFRRNIISIRWNRKQKRIILLGKTILEKGA